MIFDLKFRIIIIFSLIAALFVLVGYFAFITTKSLERVSRAIMKENVSSLKAAEELELALLKQKGLVSSYFLDNNYSWIKTLEEKKKDFYFWFKQAKNAALTTEEQIILKDINTLYKVYDTQRNKAIKLYQIGRKEEAKKVLLNDMKDSIDALYQKCENLILANESLIAQAEISSRKNVFRMSFLIWTTIGVTLCLGGFTGFFLAKKLNEHLLRAAKMATLGQLSSNVAHEIRNPLTSIKMRVYSLNEQLKNNLNIKDDLNVISEEINRLEKIVKNFLDFARLPHLNLLKCDINQILEGTISLLLPRCQYQNIEITKVFYNSEYFVNIDREQMRQAFLNILLNAVESMPNGGKLELITNKGEDSKRRNILEIKVKDTGIGMSNELKKRLFEPFFTTKTEGTGLGLFITSKIIQLHKGTIDVNSSEKRGTSVTVKLPIT